ncbi:MAG: tRNA adenosine(34) deaminase TadA [Chloracidobacterium sp.]|nr:tRNA adenosine(34) deaminase TadA [Chloracidobacterium sp.]
MSMDEFWMQKAILEARNAADIGEVPVGAVIVASNGDVLALASNETIMRSDPTAHAEILALRKAGAEIGNYRLVGATVYSTVEPCVMCAGALVNARVERLVFGTHDERFGAVESIFRICDSPELNHKIAITSGVLADECRILIQDFFRSRRK